MVQFIKQRISVMTNALVMVFLDRRYVLTAFLIAVIIGGTYPLLFPLAVGANRITLFVFRGSFFDIFLLTTLSILFGATVAMQIYTLKTCTRQPTTTGVRVVGTIVGLITSKACCLLPLILLMLGATASFSFFIRHATEVRIVGLVILTCSFYWTASTISSHKQCCS